MICKHCGGQLKYNNNYFFCENCHSKFDISAFYENTEVFIAYVENDNQGRRTKDSIISQEIYNKLENSKINTFYQRISAADLSESDLEQVCLSAAANSKIILIIGTIPEHFKAILEKYSDMLKDKTTIPIYADMNAYDIPQALNGLQALNYNNVAAISDLVKNILHILGKDKELNFVKETYKYYKHKKYTIIISVVTILILMVGISLYIVFGTNTILPSRKYEYAQNLIEKGEHIEAINVLNSIQDYPNSKNTLKSIYDKYIGYYYDDASKVGMHITIFDNINATIEITKITPEGKNIKIIESSAFENNVINFHFIDSEKNQGVATILIQNQSIELTVKTDNNEINPSTLDGINISFDINNKSDKSMLGEITTDTINEWLNNRITESKLKSQGYELDFEYSIRQNNSDSEAQYNIKNTDIKIALYSHDIYNNRFLSDDTIVNDKIVFAIAAPAKIIAPEKIGQSTDSYIKDDILCAPDTQVGCMGALIEFFPQHNTTTIQDDTLIWCTSKQLLGENNWDNPLEKYVYKY